MSLRRCRLRTEYLTLQKYIELSSQSLISVVDHSSEVQVHPRSVCECRKLFGCYMRAKIAILQSVDVVVSVVLGPLNDSLYLTLLMLLEPILLITLDPILL